MPGGRRDHALQWWTVTLNVSGSEAVPGFGRSAKALLYPKDKTRDLSLSGRDPIATDPGWPCDRVLSDQPVFSRLPVCHRVYTVVWWVPSL